MFNKDAYEAVNNKNRQSRMILNNMTSPHLLPADTWLKRAKIRNFHLKFFHCFNLIFNLDQEDGEKTGF